MTSAESDRLAKFVYHLLKRQIPADALMDIANQAKYQGAPNGDPLFTWAKGIADGLTEEVTL